MAGVVNTEMAAAWDGDEGDAWARDADRYEAVDQRLAARFQAAVAVGRDERVLDVGCGTGKSTRWAASMASDGSALGVDLSARMLEEARRRSAAAGLTNVEFLQADAQVHDFAPGSFDLAISAFGVMFFADPVAALANVGRALRPEGRVAFLVWQPFEENEWLRTIFDSMAGSRDLPRPQTGAPGPFGLADPTDVRAILADAGYVDAELADVRAPMWLGADLDDAWGFVSGLGIVRGLGQGLDVVARAEALDGLRSRIAEHAGPDGVLAGAAAWLVTARRP